jgi:hypothetical protein
MHDPRVALADKLTSQVGLPTEIYCFLLLLTVRPMPILAARSDTYCFLLLEYLLPVLYPSMSVLSVLSP